MSLGENIKLYRKKQKLTQVQLADKANISRSYLADVENNRYNPSVDTLKNISNDQRITRQNMDIISALIKGIPNI